MFVKRNELKEKHRQAGQFFACCDIVTRSIVSISCGSAAISHCEDCYEMVCGMPWRPPAGLLSVDHMVRTWMD